MNSVVSYTVCPIAADGKRGIVSEKVKDYPSYARHLHAQAKYLQAIEALKSAKGSIFDPMIDQQIVKNFVSQAQVHEDAENHALALDYLRQAESIRGTTMDITQKAVHIYKITKDYLRGIKYHEGVNYRENQSLLSAYIDLQYLNKAFVTVIEMADLYIQKYGTDAVVLRYSATAHEEMNELGHALSGFQELIKLNPSFEDDLKIGELQITIGQLNAAESHLQQMLTRYYHKKLDLVYFLLAECSMQSGSYGIATDHYLSAIRLDKTVAKYHHGLGAAYMEDSKPRESLSSFKKAFELSSTSALYGSAYARALERLFDSPRRVPVDISLKFGHEGIEHNLRESHQALQVLSSQAMNWQKRRSFASFVNPQDSNLSFFVRQNIVQTFSTEKSNNLNRNLTLALQAYCFYRANGITYSSDSSSSNLDSSQLDEVQFPFQLLETKAGDCEDLLVLMAGTLESIGTQTAFIDIPGHVMLAVKTDMSAAEITKNGLNPDYFIESQGSHWLPLETTLIDKADFVTSWLSAIRHYQQILESGLMPEIIEFADAQKLYPPSSFTKAIDNAAYKNVSEAKSLYQKDLAGMLMMTQINQEMDFRATLDSYPENISVKLQYAMWCVKMNYFDKAERLLKEIQIQDPHHFYAILNLGNIYVETSRFELARNQYLTALDKTTTQKDQVYRNLCLLEYRDMNRAKAREYFLELNNKDIIRQVDMQIYADLME